MCPQGNTVSDFSNMAPTHSRQYLDSHVSLPVLNFGSKTSSTLICRNIFHQSNTSRNRFDWYQINSDDDGVWRHILGCDLKPSSRGSTEIDNTSCGSKEVVFLVELDKFEGRTRTVTLFSGLPWVVSSRIKQIKPNGSAHFAS